MIEILEGLLAIYVYQGDKCLLSAFVGTNDSAWRLYKNNALHDITEVFKVCESRKETLDFIKSIYPGLKEIYEK